MAHRSPVPSLPPREQRGAPEAGLPRQRAREEGLAVEARGHRGGARHPFLLPALLGAALLVAAVVVGITVATSAGDPNDRLREDLRSIGMTQHEYDLRSAFLLGSGRYTAADIDAAVAHKKAHLAGPTILDLQVPGLSPTSTKVKTGIFTTTGGSITRAQ